MKQLLVRFGGFRRLGVVTLVVAICAAFAGACAPPKPVIMYYGDSLATEAAGAFTLAVTGNQRATVTNYSFGGTAPCDYIAGARQDGLKKPAAVVLEFSGNTVTPCAKAGSPTLAQTAARYTADLSLIIRSFPASTKVYVMSAPESAARWNGSDAIDNASRLAAAQNASHAVFVDAGAAVEDGHRYTRTMGCAMWEGSGRGCSAGRIVVRSSDGLHFCPTGLGSGGAPGSCSVYSSGATRFGFAMAGPVVADFNL